MYYNQFYFSCMQKQKSITAIPSHNILCIVKFIHKSWFPAKMLPFSSRSFGGDTYIHIYIRIYAHVIIFVIFPLNGEQNPIFCCRLILRLKSYPFDGLLTFQHFSVRVQFVFDIFFVSSFVFHWLFLTTNAQTCHFEHNV